MKYVAVTRGFAYPVGADVEIVRRAGGFSKLTPAQQRAVRFKQVPRGGDCSDMPGESLERYLSRGDVAIVESED